jgi:serine/threonine protein kinase/tetratricopeptide (TPR) repeat protein
MSSGERCRECGTAIPADGLGGFCAQCLLGLGLDPMRSAEGTVQNEKELKEEATALAESARSLSEKRGDWIGRYRLIEEIGRGGCGVVYMAEQEEPVRRRVALKVIKLGMDTRELVARFEAERQALALMDHPNIAKVLEAGASESGRPYFVMELVGGIKITEYCEQNQLNTRQRLDLFIEVCRAIQHAHQKGIIHRDIKPSNVLVATQDGVPVPKVIDFGIAKATQGRLTDQTVFTAFEQFMGTPAYMSPEQAQLGGLDIDTRSDIYSLGVLLYELLTGKTPFDAKELLGAGVEAMRRTIQEKEPPTPSTRLKQEALGTGPAVSGKPEIRSPKCEIDRDLDWIVMKCLEKDRSRRYETTNDLAKDIQRQLHDEPVQAGPPSKFYRFRKAVRRNQTVFTAGAVILIVLMAGTVLSTLEAIRARRAEAQALGEKRRADVEANKQEAINRFVNNMLGSADPYKLSRSDQAKGPNITMLEVLDAAALEVEAGSLKGGPAIEAAVCQTLGRTYSTLHRPEKGEPLLRRALELNRHLYGETNEAVASALKDLAQARGSRGKGDAEEMARKVTALERKLHGNEHPDVAQALLVLAKVLDARVRGGEDGKTIVETEETFREALAMQRKVTPAGSPELIGTLASLAEFINAYGGMHAEAESLLREALQIQTTVHGPKHPRTSYILNALASVLSSMNEFPEAERLCAQALAIQQELFGTNNFALVNSLGSLAMILEKQKRFAEAEPAMRQVLALDQQALPGGLDVAWWLKNLAENLRAQGRFAEAEVFSRQGVQIWGNSKRGGVGHENYWAQLETLVELLTSQNKLDEIEALYRAVLDRQKKELGTTHVAFAAMLCRFGDFLTSCNRAGEAAEMYSTAMEVMPQLSAGHNMKATHRLSASLLARGKTEEAVKLYERLIKVESERGEEANVYLGQLLHDFGEQLATQHKFGAAAEQFIKALPIRRTKQGGSLSWTLRSLGNCLIECSRPKEAEIYLRESLAVSESHNSKDTLARNVWPASRLGDALYEQGKLHEAEEIYRELFRSLRNATPSSPAQMTTILQQLVEVLYLEGKNSEVELLLIEHLSYQRNALGPQDVATGATLLALAKCLKHQAKADKVADYCGEALNVITNAGPNELVRFPSASLADMLSLGLKAQAEQLCGRVLKMSPPTKVQDAWLDEASWSVILAPKVDRQVGALSVSLARKAVEIAKVTSPYAADVGIALGPALYRAGEWDMAVAELEAVIRSQEGTPRKRAVFFLAMAHRRLGHAEIARKYYQEAVAWMTALPNTRRVFMDLRTELDVLFGGEDPKL